MGAKPQVLTKPGVFRSKQWVER